MLFSIDNLQLRALVSNGDNLRPSDKVCECRSMYVYFFFIVINHSRLSHRSHSKEFIIRNGDVIEVRSPRIIF
jgi:hypothetical protein